jgi:hypothetical protein
MATNERLPDHEHKFHYNITLGITRNGFSTIANFRNYYNQFLFGDNFYTDAVVDVMFFNERGHKGFRVFRAIEAGGSLHIDIAEELARAGQSREALGTIYARMIPTLVPDILKGKQVPTEYTAEHITPSGHRDFMHNSGSMVMTPSLGRRRSGVIFADRFTHPAYVVMVNNYFGPRIPYISDGFAKIDIYNHRGKKRSVRTGVVAARGVKLFPILDSFPDIYEFLEGQSGRIDFFSANLFRKPWIWFGALDGHGDICMEHI